MDANDPGHFISLWMLDSGTNGKSKLKDNPHVMRRFIKNNSLSLVFFLLFLISIGGQAITGWKENNKERVKDHIPAQSLTQYFSSGHFIQATFENWESEFLQMALFVMLTIWLRQKGSSESKKVDGDPKLDKEPSPRKKNAPWPVRRGGWVLLLYKNSLSIALLLLFISSFILHFYGSLKNENEELARDHLPLQSWGQYLQSSRFWFESFQNWQSEFLSVFAIVTLSVFLRQQGSPQSKPVDAPDYETE